MWGRAYDGGDGGTREVGEYRFASEERGFSMRRDLFRFLLLLLFLLFHNHICVYPTGIEGRGRGWRIPKPSTSRQIQPLVL
jgi:hypothetical protein